MYFKSFLSVVLIAVLNTGCGGGSGGGSGDFTLAPLLTTTPVTTTPPVTTTLPVTKYHQPWGEDHFPQGDIDNKSEAALNNIFHKHYMPATRDGNLLPESKFSRGADVYVAFKDDKDKYVVLGPRKGKSIPDKRLYFQYLRELKNTLCLSTFLVPKYFRDTYRSSGVLVAPNGGDNLDVHVGSKRKISLSAFEQVTRDLQTFHTQGHAYHRDIKTQNLTYIDGQVSLIDFGSVLTEKERDRCYKVLSGFTEGYLPKLLFNKQQYLDYYSGDSAKKGIKSKDYHLLSHYLRAADEYALLLSMIIATNDSAGDYDERKKEIFAAAEEYGRAPGERPCHIYDFKQRPQILLDWLRKYRKDPDAGEQIEFLLKDPVTYAETYYDSKHPSLVDLLDFSAV